MLVCSGRFTAILSRRFIFFLFLKQLSFWDLNTYTCTTDLLVEVMKYITIVCVVITVRLVLEIQGFGVREI
jgi:hypothetical protein